jgi:hypothetical protein
MANLFAKYLAKLRQKPDVGLGMQLVVRALA